MICLGWANIPKSRHSRAGGNPTVKIQIEFKLDPRLRGDDGVVGGSM